MSEPTWKSGDVVVFIKDAQHCVEGDIGVVTSIGSTTANLAYLKTNEDTIYSDICTFYTHVEVIGHIDD